MPGFDNDCAFFGHGIDTRGLDPATNPVVNQMDTDGKLLIASSAFPYIRAALPTASNGIVITTGAGSLAFSGDGTFNQQKVIYVGKHGNDANSGLNINVAKLTFGAAMTAAAAIAPATIVCLDAGVYTENINGAVTVEIFAPEATIVGSHTIGNGANWNFGFASVLAGTTGFTFSLNNGICRINIGFLDVAGNGIGFRCTDGTMNLFVQRANFQNGSLISSSTDEFVNMTAGILDVVGTGSFVNCTSTSSISFTATRVSDVNLTGTLVTTSNVPATINFMIDSLGIHNLSNITAAPDVRVMANKMSGGLLEIGSGVVDRICGTTKIEGVPIGASIASTGRFTTLAATATAHGVLIGEGTSATINATAAGTAGQILQSGGALADPVYSTSTYPSTTGAGEMLVSNLANTVISTATMIGDFTYTSATASQNRTVTISNTDNSANPSAAHLQITVGGSTSTGDAYTNYLVTGAGTYSIGIDNSDGDKLKITTGANPSAATEIMGFQSTGEITKPLQPAFLALKSSSANNVTGNGTEYAFICDTEIYDVNSDFDHNTGVFTAPVTGKYLFGSGITATGCTNATIIVLKLVTTAGNYNFSTFTRNASPSNFNAVGSIPVNMSAGDVCHFTVAVFGEAADTVDIFGAAGNYGTHIWGYLLG